MLDLPYVVYEAGHADCHDYQTNNLAVNYDHGTAGQRHQTC